MHLFMSLLLLIDELKNHNSLALQLFEEIMAKVLAYQVKFMAEKTKAMSDYA